VVFGLKEESEHDLGGILSDSFERTDKSEVRTIVREEESWNDRCQMI
jgi:hypothetical protein